MPEFPVGQDVAVKFHVDVPRRVVLKKLGVYDEAGVLDWPAIDDAVITEAGYDYSQSKRPPAGTYQLFPAAQLQSGEWVRGNAQTVTVVDPVAATPAATAPTPVEVRIGQWIRATDGAGGYLTWYGDGRISRRDGSNMTDLRGEGRWGTGVNLWEQQPGAPAGNFQRVGTSWHIRANGLLEEMNEWGNGWTGRTMHISSFYE